MKKNKKRWAIQVGNKKNGLPGPDTGIWCYLDGNTIYNIPYKGPFSNIGNAINVYCSKIDAQNRVNSLKCYDYEYIVKELPYNIQKI